MFPDKPSETSVKNATKMAIVLLISSNEYIKSVYRNMLSLNHAAKVYNIKLPDVLTEDCIELNEYNKVYDLLRTNGRINAAILGSPAQFVDIEKFKQIYQPIYNRALVVSDKYPMIHRAIMSGILRLKSFLENRLTVLEYSAKMHYSGLNPSSNTTLDIIYESITLLNMYDYVIPCSYISPILRCLPGDYIRENYDAEIKNTVYNGNLYFELYPERLYEHLLEFNEDNQVAGLQPIECEWQQPNDINEPHSNELPDIYESMCEYHYNNYNIHDYNYSNEVDDMINEYVDTFDM